MSKLPSSLKKQIIFLLTIFNGSLISCFGQDQHMTVTKFVHYLSSNSIEIHKIIDDMIKPEVIMDKKNEADSTITLLLQGLRQMIQKSGGFDHVRVLRLDEAQSITPLNLEIDGLSVKEIFIVTSLENEFLFPILVEKDKITSFSTFRKGGDKQYFLIW
jgi:hypothetical protein